MCTLAELIKKHKKSIAGITDNQTLEAFCVEYCEMLDNSTDEFVKKCVQKCISELKLIKSIDYDQHIKTAYESYCEAICYIDLKRLCNIEHIPEGKQKTPDFRVCFDNDVIYVEMKSLSFADGNLNYIASQKSALIANISREEQIKQGKRFIWTEREVLPMAKNGNNTSFSEQLNILYNKIEGNIKKDQLSKGESVLLIDLNQLGVTYRVEDNVAIEKSFNGNGYSSGMLWTLAFAKAQDRLFIAPEFEGKPNIDEDEIGFNGIMVDYPELKGLVFAVGRNPKERAFVGFYRYREQDCNAAKFIYKVCSFFNDDRNSFCFDINNPFIPVGQKHNNNV
jgi:hypothetical protein